jgi:hypothetical protein
MNITFETTKECSCYQELVNNETDRNVRKRFTKRFGGTILGAVLKTHKKLKASDNAQIYNSIVGIDNRIEKFIDVKANDPLILKVRIQEAYRKFFYFVDNLSEERSYCAVNNWRGQFNEVRDIHVFEINKHDYKFLKK